MSPKILYIAIIVFSMSSCGRVDKTEAARPCHTFPEGEGPERCDDEPKNVCTTQEIEEGVLINCPGSDPVLVEHGQDGEDGKDGEDARTPQIWVCKLKEEEE